MTMAERVLKIARKEFTNHLRDYGLDAQWKHRLANAPVTPGSSLSEAYKRRDPVTDSNWQPDFSDGSLWRDETVRVVTDLPQTMAGGNYGAGLVNGDATAYLAHTVAVEAGDVLIVEGIVYEVSDSSLPTPPLYRQLTLQRLI